MGRIGSKDKAGAPRGPGDPPEIVREPPIRVAVPVGAAELAETKKLLEQLKRSHMELVAAVDVAIGAWFDHWPFNTTGNSSKRMVVAMNRIMAHPSTVENQRGPI